MAASAPSSRAWLFGPVPDLLLGCGVLYLGITFAYASLGLDLPGNQTRALLVLLLSTPHYGATILRVYDQRREREAYALFAVWTTILLVFAFVAGLRFEAIGAWLVTIFLTWSPWHYTGQNYGIALMFLGRRGIDVTPETKRAIYVSFILSFVLTFLAMHSAGGRAPDLPANYGGADFRLRSLGIPLGFTGIATPLVAVAYLAATGVAAAKLLRKGRLRDITPWMLITLTQAMWFTVPLAFQYGGITTGVPAIDSDFRRQWFLWIAIGHAVQYLWITSYYARGESNYSGMANYFAKIVVVGNAVWTLPVVIVGFAPTSFGGAAYDSGLPLLLAAVINIHHFILDGAIWKLRDGRIARILIRNSKSEAAPVAVGASPQRRIVWAVAWAGMLVAAFVLWQRMSFPGRLSAGDFDGAIAIMDRLDRVGHDRARDRLKMGTTLVQLGMPEKGEEQIERSIRMQPSFAAYNELARVREQRGDTAGASQAYLAALELEPDRVGLLHRAAILLIELGDPEQAIDLLQRALAKNPHHTPSQTALANARAALEQQS